MSEIIEVTVLETAGIDVTVSGEGENIVSVIEQNIIEVEISPFAVPGIIPPGENDGDMLRWDEATQSWLVKAEPFDFNGIVLNPLSEPLADIEGGLWYKQTEKSVYVCTEDH